MDRYKIVDAYDFSDLQRAVNKLIPEGYEPTGGVLQYDAGALGRKFAQAMITPAVDIIEAEETGDYDPCFYVI